MEAEGGCFKTDHSDTECLLVGYRLWGIEKLLSRLVGMFAFAIYDSRIRRLFCVRDRVGIKPFYYARTPQGLLFASEIKALLKHPAVEAQLDDQMLGHHLSFRSLPAPKTLFKGVNCLAPAQLMVVDVNHPCEPTFQTYWNPLVKTSQSAGNEKQISEELRHLLQDSVRLRLESDVPVGLFLSGGLDSALLLKHMSQSGASLGTYTVGYPDHAAFDESDVAASLAAQSNAEHHAVSLSEEDFLQSFADVAYYQDQPISAPVCVSVYHLAQRARATGRKVILAGEGADEVFFGYKTWVQSRKLQRLYNAGSSLFGKQLLGIPALLAARFRGYNSKPQEMLSRLAGGHPVFWGGGMDFGKVARTQLLAGSAGADNTFAHCLAPIRAEFEEAGDPDDLAAWMSFVDLRFRLPQLMLPRLDKMGMAHSIEGRVPYLDHRLIEYVLKLPGKYRGSKGSETKPLLKTVAKNHLPEEFVMQKKRGFQAPVTQWKRTAFGKRYLPLLSLFAQKTGLFTPIGIQRLIEQKNDRLYFSLVNFMLWYCIFIDNVVDLDIDTFTLRT